jgi:hypothetical protein
VSNVDHARKRILEQRLAALLEEFEAANAQLSRTLDDVSRLRLQRQAADLERQIHAVEQQIQEVEAGRDRVAPTAGASSTGLDLKRGLERLGELLRDLDADTEAEFSTLEERLLDNERSERLFGSSENTRSERSQIVYALNQLALTRLGVSFNDLASGRDPSSRLR